MFHLKEKFIKVTKFRIGAAVAVIAGMACTITASAVANQPVKAQQRVSGVDVSITADGETLPYTLKEGTVEEALRQAEIYVSQDDLVYPPQDAQIQDGDHITVTRIYYTQETDIGAIPYEEVEIENSAMAKGRTVVSTRGVEGSGVTTYQVKHVDGVEVSREMVSRQVVREPVDQVITKGTKEEKAAPSAAKKTAVTSSSAVKTVSALSPSQPVQLDKNGDPVSYKKLITGKATAYTASEGARTATGKLAQTGYVAVNPKQIPYGSRLYIKTPDGKVIYGYAVAEDTGGFAKKGRVTVDLYFDTYEECIQFGLRSVEIYVL